MEKIMNLKEAKNTIEELLNGSNPMTGVTIPSESVFNEPIVMRALMVSVKALEVGITKPLRKGEPWTRDEYKRLRDSFNQRKSFKEIADDFQRTEKAIISKLVFLGLIEDPYQR